MRFIILLLITVTLLTSCSGGKTGQTVEYPLNVKIDLSEASTNPIKLSELADEVRYIPLEITDSVVLGSVDGISVKLSSDFIFAESGGELFRFSNTGKYLNKIVKSGRGPGEVNQLIEFAVDAVDGKVYVFDRSGYRIKIFDYNGVFCGELDNLLEYRGINTMGFYNRRLFATITQTQTTKDLAIWYDSINDTLLSLQPNIRKYAPEQINNFNALKTETMSMQVCDTLLLYKEYFCDTVFSVNNDFVVSPRFIIDMGSDKYEWESYRDQMYNFNVRMPTYGYYVTALAESENNLLMNLGSASGDRVFVVHKKGRDENKIQLVYFNPDDRRIKLENDLDGMVDFIIQNSYGLYLFDGYLYTLIEAYDFKKAYDEATEEEKTASKYLRDMAPVLDGIDEFDNPVLMLVKLK